MFGLPYDYSTIIAISKKYNLLVIEDGAQGFGGQHKKQLACSLGDISTTSFFPTKPLGCYGDGGAIFTNEDNVNDYLRSLRVHGQGSDKYDNVRIGMNSRLDTIQAAVLQVKLKAFKDYELEARRKVAALYNENLAGAVVTPFIPEEFQSNYALYSVLFNDELTRDNVRKALEDNCIPSMIYYQKLLHQQPVYRNNTSIHRDFNNSLSLTKRILSLPMGPYLQEDQIVGISRLIKKCIGC